LLKMAWRSTVLLSALQLHRKTIKFQKPDTTQGGITFKARYCLLFSVLNKILRVGASGWFIMNRDSVHMICRPSP
ncbi:Phage holin, partial [Dysosmobacter welbionis]